VVARPGCGRCSTGSPPPGTSSSPPTGRAARAAQLAAVSGVKVLPCAAQTSRRHTLRSWDRMVLPLPFGRGVIVCGPPISVAREDAAAALPTIAAALTEAAAAADRLCP
jgi:lysophospholipid acyltransferase (LPLAT)-like uncharacterized protein